MELSYINPMPVLFDLMPNPIEDLPFALVIEGEMLFAVSRAVPPVREGRFDTGVWTVEFKSLKTRILLEEFPDSV
jgi:hypothetical protein